jgi:hypothetical protein
MKILEQLESQIAEQEKVLDKEQPVEHNNETPMV